MTVATGVLVLLGPVVLLIGVPALVLWVLGHLPEPRTGPGPTVTTPADAAAARHIRCAELRRRGLARYPRAVGAHFPTAGQRVCRAHCESFAGRRRRDEQAVVLFGTAIGRYIGSWCPDCPPPTAAAGETDER